MKMPVPHDNNQAKARPDADVDDKTHSSHPGEEPSHVRNLAAQQNAPAPTRMTLDAGMAEVNGPPVHSKPQREPSTATLIASLPGILSGEPCFVGTRVPVAMVVAYLEAGHSEADIYQDFPMLPANAIPAARDWSERGAG